MPNKALQQTPPRVLVGVQSLGSGAAELGRSAAEGIAVSQRTRRLFGVAVLAAMLGVWGYFLVRELPYALGGVTGTAKVDVAVYGSRGRVRAKVTHEVGGQPVRASLNTYFYRLREGDEVPVVYLPDDPTVVEPADPWRRFGPVLVLGLALGVVCYTTGVFGLFRRQEGTDGDPPPMPTPGKIAEPGAAADGGA